MLFLGRLDALADDRGRTISQLGVRSGPACRLAPRHPPALCYVPLMLPTRSRAGSPLWVHGHWLYRILCDLEEARPLLGYMGYTLVWPMFEERMRATLSRIAYIADERVWSHAAPRNEAAMRGAGEG